MNHDDVYLFLIIAINIPSIIWIDSKIIQTKMTHSIIIIIRYSLLYNSVFGIRMPLAGMSMKCKLGNKHKITHYFPKPQTIFVLYIWFHKLLLRLLFVFVFSIAIGRIWFDSFFHSFNLALQDICGGSQKCRMKWVDENCLGKYLLVARMVGYTSESFLL